MSNPGRTGTGSIDATADAGAAAGVAVFGSTVAPAPAGFGPAVSAGGIGEAAAVSAGVRAGAATGEGVGCAAIAGFGRAVVEAADPGDEGAPPTAEGDVCAPGQTWASFGATNGPAIATAATPMPPAQYSALLETMTTKPCRRPRSPATAIRRRSGDAHPYSESFRFARPISPTSAR